MVYVLFLETPSSLPWGDARTVRSMETHRHVSGAIFCRVAFELRLRTIVHKMVTRGQYQSVEGSAPSFEWVVGVNTGTTV